MIASGDSVPTNRLIDETSPYLLQHAHNPVDWYPWGPEALGRAQAEDKPILLSVGYAACHWCHVMAHESFEDPDIARLMNQLYVCIKVDREERPDVDALYMEAVQAMTGQGGWPMTVFLMPDGKPFYGGTYYPPTPRYGMPSFSQILLAVADAWRTRREEFAAHGERMIEALRHSAQFAPGSTALAPALLDPAAPALLSTFDPVAGGFGRAPKFPQPMILDFLLQTYRRTGDQGLLHAASHTLTRMARGGMYDQLGGGFHRYSTDAEWLVPHFEKMLYDNAQLARTYLHAWQITGDAAFRQVVEETLDYVLREMTSNEGGFYSSQDADSEGKEGKFFLWTPAEVTDLLGEEDGRLFAAYFDVTPGGNFREGGSPHSILHVPQDRASAAEALRVTPERLDAALARGKRILFAARSRRVAPGRDEKILAEWNGLMLHALAEAGAVLGRPDYLAAAERNAAFILDHLAVMSGDGALRLNRSYKDGRAHLPGYLEDYAAVGLGLLGLYEATLNLRWFKAASAVPGALVALFSDPAGGGFFQTSAEHETLPVRRKDLIDNALPSGNSLAAELFLRLARLQDRAEYFGYAEAILRSVAEMVGEHPAAFGRLLSVLDALLYRGYEIAVVGDAQTPPVQAMLREVWRRYLPDSVLALAEPGDREAAALIPFLAGRSLIGGRPAAYVCRHYVCRLPVMTAEALAAQLA